MLSPAHAKCASGKKIIHSELQNLLAVSITVGIQVTGEPKFARDKPFWCARDSLFSTSAISMQIKFHRFLNFLFKHFMS
jgi:hypothetical protein